MKKIIFIFCTTALLVFNGCSKNIVYDSDNRFLLDTVVTIQLYHYQNQSLPTNIFNSAFDLMKADENQLSVHVDGSDLDLLRQEAGQRPIQVDSFTYDIVKESTAYSTWSNGLFDVTSGPLIDLWDIHPPEGHVPTENELAKTLPLIDYNDIQFLDNHRLMLEKSGMMINLGAIAKGAITDHTKEFLLSKGVNSGVINAGGNVLLIGSKPDGESFSIGIQDPNNNRGTYLMALSLSDKAVVSSGDYERFFEQDGVIYHHILNPFTGYPANTNIKQVTIVAPTAIQADALSTTVLLMGLHDGIALVESMDDTDAIFITKDSNIYVTQGLNETITYEEPLMENYTLIKDPALLN